MTQFLTRTPVIWILFVLQIVIGASFLLFIDAVGGQLLDMLNTGEEARATVAGMTEAQRTAHIWVTILLDIAYPLVLGGFLAAMALRFFGNYGKIAALPAFAAIIVDLTENMIQVLALSGTADVLDAKDWVTPLKSGLFTVAAAIALIALVIAIIRMIRKPAA